MVQWHHQKLGIRQVFTGQSSYSVDRLIIYRLEGFTLTLCDPSCNPCDTCFDTACDPTCDLWDLICDPNPNPNPDMWLLGIPQPPPPCNLTVVTAFSSLFWIKGQARTLSSLRLALSFWVPSSSADRVTSHWNEATREGASAFIRLATNTTSGSTTTARTRVLTMEAAEKKIDPWFLISLITVSFL